MDFGYLAQRTARLYGDRIAIRDSGLVLTMAQVRDRAARLAGHLLANGCVPGDRVGLLLGNRAEYLEIELGLAMAGLVRVALNVRLPRAVLSETLKDSRARALIYGSDFGEAGRFLETDVPFLATAVEIGPSDAREDGHYERALRAAAPAAMAAAATDDQLYSLFYTSGTTGKPKGVMLTTATQLAVAMSLLLEFGPVDPGDRLLTPQPLSHGGGFFMLPWFISGGEIIVMESFDAARMMDLAERHAVQTIKAIPTMLVQLAEAAIECRLPALKQVVYGASPMPVQPLLRLIDSYGPVFTQLYGQAEAPMCISVLTRLDHSQRDPARLASAGRPWRNAEVHVVDEHGAEVPDGEIGEVVVRNPGMMSGYWEREDLTAQVLRDGWVHTRDMGRFDAHGYLHLLGRTDDMIISGGFNIPPRVVEDVLNAHPAVLEAAVVGFPDAKWGQIVKAFVALRAGYTCTTDELIEYSKEPLGFQRPRAIEILQALPKNAYGKVVKSELLQRVGG